MNRWNQKWGQKIIGPAIIWITFLLGIWLVVLRVYGPGWELIPGDLADARFNHFILEHFYRWATGLEKSYWDAGFFFPFKSAIAFSDNLLGSAPIYAIFRWLGVDKETSYQCWYLLGYCLNFACAAFVLSRMRFMPLAVAAGAFFFSFGLPILAQEEHSQLLYRFGIPLACFFLQRFFNNPRLASLGALAFFVVWQFYLSIYLGVFLALLLLVLAILLPLSMPAASPLIHITAWPKQLGQAWKNASMAERGITTLILIGLGFLLLSLMGPYRAASVHYGLLRQWSEMILPDWKNYFSADASRLWQPIRNLLPNTPAAAEQQLFPGMSVILLVLIGVLWRFRNENTRLAWVYLAASILLILLTLNFNGYSAYWFLWQLPGIKSIRAVGRIELVLMWPIALFIAWSLDGLVRNLDSKVPWLAVVPILLVGLLVAESAFFDHITFSKPLAQARVQSLIRKIPANIPEDAVLFFADNKTEFYFTQEIDAMFAAQELGLATLNGYSGNFPPGYEAAANCIQVPKRIRTFMKFENISSNSYYIKTIQRIVPIGFTDCDPGWWQHSP